MKQLFFWSAAICILFSCSNTKTTTGTASGSEILYQQQWNLTSLNGQTVPSTTTAHLLFTAGQINRVSGSTGCNRLSGVYELSGTKSIKFLPLAVTKMACLDNGANETETKFLAALQQATVWSATTNELVFSNGATVVAKLQGVKPATAEEKKLNGSWELTYISGQKIAFNGLFPDKKPTINFNVPSPVVNGNGSCNGYGGQLKVEGNKITVSNIISTMMACEGGGEPIFFRTLEKVTHYSIGADNSLTMLTGDIAVMKFIKK
jgi:heat shock protein HslJ